MQTRQLYADHRPWTQRRRRRDKLLAPRLDAKGKPKADMRAYHVNVSMPFAFAPGNTPLPEMGTHNVSVRKMRPSHMHCSGAPMALHFSKN